MRKNLRNALFLGREGPSPLSLRSDFPGLYCLWLEIRFKSQIEQNVALQDLTPEFEASKARSGTFSASPPLLLRLCPTKYFGGWMAFEVSRKR
jgi:hypothetical protein